MKLALKDAEYSINLFKRFMINANYKLKVLNKLDKPDDFLKFTIEQQMNLRKKIYKNMDLYLESFLKDGKLNKEESEIVESWKNYILDRFIVYKHLSDYTVFINTNDNKVYGVVGLLQDWRELAPDFALPLMINTMIFPFKDKIIYDGIFSSFSIQFGSGIRKEFEQTYQKAKSSNEIITFLPFEDKKTNEEKDADNLRFYLKTKKNFQEYIEEVYELKNKNDSLNIIFNQEFGKLHSKDIKKELKKLGIKGHFAIIRDIVVASGKDEKSLDKNLNEIVPKNLHEIVYKFNI